MKIPKRLPCLAVLLLAPLMMAPAQNVPEKLAMGNPSWNNTTPSQLVEIDGEVVGFEAQIGICSGRRPKGFGFIEISSSEGVELRLVPVAGFGLREQEDAVILILAPDLARDETILPANLAVAIVRPVPGSPGRQSWDIKLDGDRPFLFEAEGTIDDNWGESRCQSVDFGQLINTRGEIDAPLQPIVPASGAIVGFESSLVVLPDNQARGLIAVDLVRQPTRTYHAFYGAPFRDRDTGAASAQVFLILADPASTDPLSTDADVLRATVTESADEDCLIWDLINGTTGQVNGTVETTGSLEISGR